MKINNDCGDFIELTLKDSSGKEQVFFVENILLTDKPNKTEPFEKLVQWDLSKPYLVGLPKKKKEPLYKSTPELHAAYKNKKATWEKEKRKSDPIFKLKKDTRSLVRASFISRGFKKYTKTETILGCTLQEFKLHIEKQFEPWMSWDNHGVYNHIPNTTWQIDHIIPLETAKTSEDIIKLNHHINLRPLCSKLNSERRYNN